jgi:hypothetical protein
MADFYGTIADADAYYSARLNAGWTGEDTAKTAALIRASSWIDATYGARFGGIRTGGREQLLAWPRTNACDGSGEAINSDAVPIEVERAVYEAALRELTAPGSLSPDIIPGSIKKRVRVEGAVEIEYAAGRAKDMMPILAAVDGLLAPLLSRGAVTTNWVMRA